MLLNIHLRIAEGQDPNTAQQAADELLDALGRACTGNERSVWLPPGSVVEGVEVAAPELTGVGTMEEWRNREVQP